jgi:hypothetical protein
MTPQKKTPKHVTLYFAVIDGADPEKWPVFEKPFGELFKAARTHATPNKVTERLRRQFTVEIEPLMVGPAALLEEQNLDKVVGVIIDALPKESGSSEFDSKLDTLQDLFLKQTEQSDKPLYQKFGYKVWFATDNSESEDIARFVDQVRLTLEASLKQKVKVDYFTEEALLSFLMIQCLHDAYFNLAEGVR